MDESPTYRYDDRVKFRDVGPGWTLTVLAVGWCRCGDHPALRLMSPDTDVSWYCSLTVEPAEA